MQNYLVLTLSGHDRIGIVEQVSKMVLDYGGNVEASRMARLGGEFAMLMLISTPSQHYGDLKEGLQKLQEKGYHVTTCQTELYNPEKYMGWMPYQLELSGADHEGIIHHITHLLAEYGVNIETMDASMVKAPMSGTPLFIMTATILIPPDLSFRQIQQDLASVGNELNVDIDISPYVG